MYFIKYFFNLSKILFNFFIIFYSINSILFNPYLDIRLLCINMMLVRK